jgi:tetratricopeptide (TPR) repeat protein
MKAKDALILAKEHLAADRLQEAGRLFGALIGIPALAAEANAGLGYVALKANAPQQAATYFERALAGDLSNAQVAFVLGLVCEELKLWKRAEQAYQLTLRSNPSHSKVRAALARVKQKSQPPASSAPKAASAASAAQWAEFHIPKSEEDFEEYKRLRVKKARADFWIQKWHQYPPVLRWFQVGMTVVILGGFISLAVFMVKMAIAGSRWIS